MDTELMEQEIPAPIQRRDRGFTLVELLIVIVILGVLSTVAVFAVRGISDRGTASACQADYKVLETATEAYVAQLGVPNPFPATFETNLKTAGFLREVSSKYDIVAINDIDPVVGSSCSFDPDGL